MKDCQVSNLGRVKSSKRIKDAILRPGITSGGYKAVNLHNNGAKTHTIHRLVALHYIDNPENKICVNHKWGIKTDNRSTELEWATYSENQFHAYKLALRTSPNLGKFDKDNHLSKSVLQFTKNGELIAKYGSQSEASRITGINRANISSVCNGSLNTAGGYKWNSV